MTETEKFAGVDVQSERSAGHAADLLDLLLEQVVDYAIFVLDRDGNIASWNAGAQRIKGYKPQEIIGKPYAVFFGEQERRDGMPQDILGHTRTHGRFVGEGWRVRKDGSRFWASVVITALHDDDGEIKGFAKITRDLTERKQAEEDARLMIEERAARRQAELDEREIRRSRDHLDLILRNVAEGVTAQTADGRWVFANDAAAHMCGFESAAAMLGASREQVLAAFEVLREDGTPFPLDELPGRVAVRGKASKAIVRFKTKRTKEERWSLVSAAPVLDPDGRVEFAVSVFHEFTERRRSEDAWQFLADASSALGSSLDYGETLRKVASLAVPRIADWCGVDIASADGTLEQIAVAHVDPTKVQMAKEWRRRWPPRPDDALHRVLRTGLAEFVPEVTDAMIEASTPDPDQRRLMLELGLRSVMIVPLTAGREPFGVVSFITAESGRQYGPKDLILATEVARRASLAVENARAYTEARRAVETRDNFLAIASHELRTPLSALTTITTSLLRVADQGRLDQLGPGGLRERMARAERQTKQLARLLDRLLDVTRLSTRDLQLERETMDLSRLAREVIARYEDLATETGNRIELEAPSVIIGDWDRCRLDQVLTNLIGNALKYAPGTLVRVSLGAGASSGHVRLAVSDGGPGIPAESQERIFGQFERATADDLPGMGLGLWLVRRIVAAHGGAVILDSRLGSGATFNIILPARAEAPAYSQDRSTSEDNVGDSA